MRQLPTCRCSRAPDVEISARDLVQAFADNEQRATRAYVTGDRTIQVSGTVRRMVTDERSHRTVVTLDAGDLGSVSCTLVSPGASSMKAVSAGAQMTVKGQCTGMQELFEKEVVMIRCVVVGQQENRSDQKGKEVGS